MATTAASRPGPRPSPSAGTMPNVDDGRVYDSLSGSLHLRSRIRGETMSVRTQATEFKKNHQVVDLGVARSSRGVGTKSSARNRQPPPRRSLAGHGVGESAMRAARMGRARPMRRSRRALSVTLARRSGRKVARTLWGMAELAAFRRATNPAIWPQPLRRRSRRRPPPCGAQADSRRADRAMTPPRRAGRRGG